jgi:hypothetical protein
MTTDLKTNLENIDKSKPSTRGTPTVEDRIGKVAVDAMMFEIGRLPLGPDDILVMAPPADFTVMQAHHMAEAFRAQLDGHGVKNPLVVYAGGTRVGVLSPHRPWWRRLLGR